MVADVTRAQRKRSCARDAWPIAPSGNCFLRKDDGVLSARTTARPRTLHGFKALTDQVGRGAARTLPSCSAIPSIS